MTVDAEKGESYGASAPEAVAVATLQPSMSNDMYIPTTTMPNTTMPVTAVASGSGTYGTAVQVGGSSLPMSQQEKIGSKCCGCCCKYPLNDCWCVRERGRFSLDARECLRRLFCGFFYRLSQNIHGCCHSKPHFSHHASLSFASLLKILDTISQQPQVIIVVL
jgi:hypothetical protein